MCDWCQKRALDALKLELQKVLNPIIGAGNLGKQALLTTKASIRNVFFFSSFFFE